MNLAQYIENQPVEKRVSFIKKLAKRVGLSPVTISSMRCGQRRITPDNAVLLEKASNGQMTRKELCPKVFN
jgi:DNA-binding transcriptional regulator YdaS (Cro superfamily)